MNGCSSRQAAGAKVCLLFWLTDSPGKGLHTPRRGLPITTSCQKSRRPPDLDLRTLARNVSRDQHVLQHNGQLRCYGTRWHGAQHRVWVSWHLASSVVPLGLGCWLEGVLHRHGSRTTPSRGSAPARPPLGAAAARLTTLSWAVVGGLDCE